MIDLLARVAMILHLARFVLAARYLRMRLSDWWLDVKYVTADGLATDAQRDRARMYGDLFAAVFPDLLEQLHP